MAGSGHALIRTGGTNGKERTSYKVKWILQYMNIIYIQYRLNLTTLQYDANANTWSKSPFAFKHDRTFHGAAVIYGNNFPTC